MFLKQMELRLRGIFLNLNPKAREVKPKQKKTKQTTRTETEPQNWRSHGGLSIGDWEGESGGKGTENK